MVAQLLLAVMVLSATAAGERGPSCPLREAQSALRAVLTENPRSAQAPPQTDGVNEDADEESFGLNGTEALPNFGTVSTGVYRSGQFNREGLLKLRDLGVKTILNIREKVSEEESREAAALGMSVVHVAMSGLKSPSFDQVDRALKTLADPALRPVLVHCRYGKDRTGVTVASFRTRLQGWTVPAAVAEAKTFGCCMPLFRDLQDWLKDYLSR